MTPAPEPEVKQEEQEDQVSECKEEVE